MAGLYVHIPFCKSRCIYCGFYSTTRKEMMEQYVDALLKELNERNKYDQYDTVYIGGGTPSQLPLPLLERLLEALPHSLQEFTVECNPDDVTPQLAALLYKKGVNRVSMGAQTFSEERLRFLHRRHTPQQVREAVETLRSAGIENISLDLMFGFPGETLDEWIADIDTVLALHPEHISAYSLMYEEDTPLYRMLEKGEIEELDEELCRTMYYTLKDKLEAAGYEHYEISNFAKQGYRSKHNSSYWNNTPYLGIGAGAHSYDGDTRSYNTDTLNGWHQEVELLDEVTKYNDMITTAMRTREGVQVGQCSGAAGQVGQGFLLSQAEPLIKKGLLSIDNNRLHLTREALYTCDDVLSDLIYV